MQMGNVSSRNCMKFVANLSSKVGISFLLKVILCSLQHERVVWTPNIRVQAMYVNFRRKS